MRRVFSLLEIFLQDFLLLSSPFNDYDMALLEFSVSQSLNKHFTRKVKHEEMVVCCRKSSLDRNHPSNWINYREISDCLFWILKQESAQFATFLLIQSSFPCLSFTHLFYTCTQGSKNDDRARKWTMRYFHVKTFCTITNRFNLLLSSLRCVSLCECASQ